MTPTPGASRIQSYHAHRLDAVDREPLSLDVLWPEDRRDAHPDPPTSSKVLPRPAHVDPDLYPLFDGALAPIETDNWAYRLGCVQRADYKVGLDDVAARAARAASCALPPDIVPVRNRGRGPYGGSFQSPKLLGMYEAQAGVALYAQAVGNPGCGLTVLGVLTRTLARSVPSMHGLARKMTDLHAILFEDANAPYLLEDARINSRGGRSFTLTTTVEEVKAGLVVPSHHHLLDSTPAGRAFRCAVVKGAAEIAQEALSFMLSADEYQQLCDEGELIVCPAAVVGAASHAEQVNPATYGGGMRDLGALQMSLHSDSGDAKRWTVFIVFFRSFEDPDGTPAALALLPSEPR
jgi:hypothetical protein